MDKLTKRQIGRYKLFISALFLLFLKLPLLSAEPVRIGYITDLSGPGAFMGVQTQRGALIASDEINVTALSAAGEIAGDSLKIFFEDTRGKPSEALTAVIKLLNEKKVDGIICDLTAICTAISQKVHQSGKALIYHSPSHKIREANPYAMRNFIDYLPACRLVAENWKKQGRDLVLSLMANSEFGELCEAGARESGDITGFYNYNSGDDIRSLVTAIKQSIKGKEERTGILFTGFEGDFVNLFNVFEELNIKAAVGFPEIILSDVLIKAAGKNLDLSSIYGFEEISPEFREMIRKRFNISQEPNLQGVALGSNAVKSLYASIKNCNGSRDIGCIIRELRSNKSSKLLGFRGFATGNEEYPIVLKTWQEIRSSR